MDQVQAYVQNNCVNLTNLDALIDILENAFGNPNRAAEAEAKLRTIQGVLLLPCRIPTPTLLMIHGMNPPSRS